MAFVVRTKSQISSQRREELVRQEAWWLFLKRESAGRQLDWQDAIGQCGLVSVFVGAGHPRWADVVAEAEKNWLHRKDRDAQMDWLDAEARVNQEYEVV